jgi:NitT/TauT family transport system permease protein
MRIRPPALAAENARLAAEGKAPAGGRPANPIFLPAPHEVFRALVTAFFTEPRRPGDAWLHESLWHSIQIIFWGFLLSAVLGVPLGILCGTFDFFSRLAEPFTDFIRYMPAPAFGALAVAVLGIADAPKIAIIFIGTYFQMVLVVAHTTRLLDVSLIEAAETLGANRRQLVVRVVVPGILPNLYNDLRILLGWAWTYLIVAELIGATSGISYFINQQGKYRNYDNVFAGIILIGIVGLLTDQILAYLARFLFPWQGKATDPTARRLLRTLASLEARIARHRPRHGAPGRPLTEPARSVLEELAAGSRRRPAEAGADLGGGGR